MGKIRGGFIDFIERHPLFLVPLSILFSLGAPVGWFILDKLVGRALDYSTYKVVLLIYMAAGTLIVFLIFISILIFLIDRISETSLKMKDLKEMYEKDYLKLKERMMGLSSAAGEIAKSKDEDEVFYKLAEVVHTIIGLDRVIVFRKVFKDEKPYLQLVEARGVKQANQHPLIYELLPCDENLGSIAVVCRKGISILYNKDDVLAEKYKLKPPYDKIKTFRSRSFIVVPVKVRDEVIAVIAGDRRFSGECVTRDDLVMVEIIADAAAHTIYSIRTKQKLEELARVDSLTGLYNRRYWFELAEKEYKKAKRYKMPFSVLMLDIDDFKKINDTFGHHIGDHVLSVLGRIMKENLREVDIPGRYGGEEFVALLPMTDEEAAYKVGERIREAVEETFFGIDKKVTVTVGVASYSPLKDMDFNRVLLLADKALYYGKKTGKNKTVRASEVEEKSEQQGIQKL